MLSEQEGVSMFSYEVALDYWEIFLLILVRIASFVNTAPFFNMSNTPQRTKLGLSFFISMIIFTLIPEREVVYDGVIGYAALVIKESIAGLLLGFVCNVCVQTITFAGHLIDFEIGLSMASMYDPTMNEQVSVSGSLYHRSVFLLLMISGMYQFLISAIVDSYGIIPVGELTVNSSLYGSVLGIVTEYVLIGFRIALPIFVTSMILNAILGILTKVAPQMNMFAVGIQIKLLVGLAIMFLTVSLLPSISSYIMNMMKQVIKSVAGGLI